MKTIRVRDTAIVLVLTEKEAVALKKRLDPSHGFLPKKSALVVKVEDKLMAALGRI